jgi:hypothetical protein
MDLAVPSDSSLPPTAFACNLLNATYQRRPLADRELRPQVRASGAGGSDR